MGKRKIKPGNQSTTQQVYQASLDLKITTEKEPITKTEKVLNWFRNHRYFSWVIIILTGASLIGSAYQLFDLVSNDIAQAQQPHIEVQLVRGNVFDSQLDVTPLWKNETNSGFSEPLDVQIALRNTGKKDATNVNIYLITHSCCISLFHQSGESVPGALVADATNIFEGNFVSHYALDRVSPSPVLDLFENRLQIKLRFQIVIGTPTLDKVGTTNLEGVEIETPILSRVHITFKHSDATSGSFPIHYLVTYAETNEPVSGVLYLNAPASVLTTSDNLVNINAPTNFVGAELPPMLDDIYVVNEKNVKIPSTANMTASSDSMVIEKRHNQLALVELYVGQEKMYVEADSNGDGYVDALYLHEVGLDTDIEQWWRFSFKEKTEFLPVSLIGSSIEDIVDISRELLIDK